MSEYNLEAQTYSGKIINHKLEDFFESPENRYSNTDPMRGTSILYRTNNKNTLGNKAAYNKEFHKWNPLQKYLDGKYHILDNNGDISNEWSNKFIMKGYSPLLNIKETLNPGKYNIYYECNDDPIKYGKLKIIGIDGTNFNKIINNVPPIIVVQAQAGGGSGGSAYTFGFIYSDACGGGAGGYFHFIINLVELVKEKITEQLIMNIEVGKGAPKTPGSDFGHSGEDGEDTKITIYQDVQYLATANGGKRGTQSTGNDKAAGGSYNIDNIKDLSYIYKCKGKEGTAGRENNVNTQIESFSDMICYSYNKTLSTIESIKMESKKRNPGGCSVMGIGGGAGNDSEAGIGYGSGGSGGIPWFANKDGKRGGAGAPGCVRFLW